VHQIRCNAKSIVSLTVLSLGILLGGTMPATAQQITSVSMLTDPLQTSDYPHVLNIIGTGFTGTGFTGLTPAQVVLIPNETVASGSTAVNVRSPTLIEVQFTAPVDYQVQGVVLSPTGLPPITFAAPPATCRLEDVLYQYEITPDKLARDTFGNGLAKNFFVVQLSIINKCRLKIIVPIAGIQVTPEWDMKTDAKTDTKTEANTGHRTISPYGLDHVVAAYNTDRTSTGSRAILLNAMQALTTVGSAVQLFFGPGFAQGVAIFGGGLRNAVLEISKDLSAAQLKSLTSETFQTTEVIGTTGNPGIQKFIFIPKTVVTLPTKGKQRIIDIKKINLTWSVADNTTQTSAATSTSPATTPSPTN